MAGKGSAYPDHITLKRLSRTFVGHLFDAVLFPENIDE
jgi:hypothetical protein